METELRDLYFRQIAVILRLTYPPSVSASLQNFYALLLLLLETCWIEIIIFLCKLLYRKTEKSLSLTTVYTLSIWKSVLKNNFSRHQRSTNFFV